MPSVRPIGTSLIAFGLVSLPIKIYSTAESSRRVSFNMIWKERGVRVRQQYIDPADGAVVPRSEIVKGYEFDKDRFVTFTKEELEVVETPMRPEIEIVSFVPADSVDRLYSSRAYFLGPGEGGARPYRLLAEALRRTGRVAIAKQAARGKQHIVAIRPHRDAQALVMEQLYYADEVRPVEVLEIDEGEVSDTELALAEQLIAQGSADAFDPSQFRDEVREKTLGLIQAKVEGERIVTTAKPRETTKIIDLMEALKASIATSEAGSTDGQDDEDEAETRAVGAA
ncbi:MAG: Ku protein [Gemmatimonadetes bacterium]|nr:Ku protein [Gemmatimonadota bacterium]